MTQIERSGLANHPVGTDQAGHYDDQMPVRTEPSVGRELGPDRSGVLGGLVDLESEDCGSGLGRVWANRRLGLAVVAPAVGHLRSEVLR